MCVCVIVCKDNVVTGKLSKKSSQCIPKIYYNA